MARSLWGGLLVWLKAGTLRRQEGMADMVAMTERAGALLERIQAKQSLPHPQRLELRPEDDAITIGMTDPTPSDELLYHGGTLVLYVSPPAADVLAGYTVTTLRHAAGAGARGRTACAGRGVG
jgi:hypothetical protein